MHLVNDHVLELLILNGPNEDVALERLAGQATEHDVLAKVVEAMLHERHGALGD
jgi:hypothetical protein